MIEASELVPDYLLIGHIAHDVTPQGPQLGGTVSFAAYTAVAFGLRVGILTSAARDEPLLRDLPARAMVTNVLAEHTTTFKNEYARGKRTQYMYRRAAALRLESIPGAWRRARLIHLAPIAYEVDPELVTAFGDSPVCVTPQGWMRRREPDGLVMAIPWETADEVLPYATLTVLSEEDIRHDPGLETVFARSAPTLIVTRNGRNGTVYRNGLRHEFPVQAIDPLDPTGAGDIFAAALHIALDRLGDLNRALRVATRLAGHSVGRSGFASAPTPEEVAQALNDSAR